MHSMIHPLKRLSRHNPNPQSTSIPSLLSTQGFDPIQSPRLHPILPHPRAYADLLTSLSKQATLLHTHHPFDETLLRNLFSRSCKTLHARTLKLGFGLSRTVGSALVDLYSKCGQLCYSRRVFDRLEERDAATWNSVLSAHSRHGSPVEVLCSFRSMRSAGVLPDQFGFAITLSACSRLKDLDLGKQVHCTVVKTGLESNSFSEGSLIDMYSKCNHVADARKVFEKIDSPDTVSWTNMIAAYSRIGMCNEAVELFSEMLDRGGAPDQVVYVTTITALLSLGRLDDAEDLFWQMPLPNAVAWNVMISGYAQNGCAAEALSFFKEMRSRRVKPTRSTLGSVLSAAANLMALNEGRQVHSEAIRFGLDSNVFVGSSLVNLYAKCFQIEDARKVFDFTDVRNTVMWNAMLSGCVQNGYAEEVMHLFFDMKRLDSDPDDCTFVNVLGACGCLENLSMGRQLHAFAVKNSSVSNLFVGNAVLDMYAKCGELSDAKRQFKHMPIRDIVSWNAIIAGFAHNEEEDGALSLFQRMMMMDEVLPDEISLATVLSACSNLQAFEEGRQIHCLSIKSNLNSNLYVASSLVDLYAKHGEIEAAKRVYVQMHQRSDYLYFLR
ncbi:pentatricopeptide repeat-containing protein [Canna indica]|uniref:Pentatricopeptide repeat-containing protein n=1 Tax=Canna indica TaxID=4628 RepID=A0AAQ3QEK3_9LILI|nr:pentatricopeptide repeat-containing protein [Canna indica]